MARKLSVIFALVLAVAPQRTWAGEVTWLRIDSHMEYRDLTTTCSNEPFGAQLFFAVETEGGAPLRANFVKSPGMPWMTQSIPFSADELQGLKLHRDEVGRYWLKRVSVSQRLAAWLVPYSAVSTLCRVPEGIATAEPAPIDLEFEVSGLSPGNQMSRTPWIKFGGLRVDNMPYNVDLSLTQRRHGAY